MKNDVSEITGNVKTYFTELKNIKPLTKKVERELLIDYKKNNNLTARDKVLRANLKYACKLASQYRNRGVSYSDLISEANMGLIDAIERFDINQDVKLISYSKWWIMQRMQSAIMKRDRMPESELPTDNEAQLSDEEEYNGQVQQRPQSEDTFIIDEETKQEETNTKQLVEELTSCLSDKEMDIINMYYGRAPYGEGYTLDYIGKKYHLTKERIRQIIAKSFRKIRTSAMMTDSSFLSGKL